MQNEKDNMKEKIKKERMFKMKLNKLDKWEVGGVPLSELAPTLIKYGAIAGFLAALLALKHIF